MTPKQETPPSTYITARVPLALAEEFRKIAEADYRTVSAELRRLMEQRVAENGEP